MILTSFNSYNSSAYEKEYMHLQALPDSLVGKSDLNVPSMIFQ